MSVQRMRRIGIICTLLGMMFMLATLHAQDSAGGRFCVRAFEDLNANQTRDPGEPLITTDLIINLQNATGVVIASAQMDDPFNETRAQGLYCFDNLPAGQYSVLVSSAVFAPTTPDNLTATIAAGDLPALLEYGAQRTTLDLPQTSITDDYDAQNALERVLIALMGGLASMALVGLFGVILYWFVLRDSAAPKDQAPVDPDAPFRRPR